MNLKEISKAASELLKRAKVETDLQSTISQTNELKELITELNKK